MQIRLTVTLGPRGGGPGAGSAASAPGAAPACDVVVTAPTGTPLSAVTGALVSTATSVSGVHGSGGVHAHGSGSDSAGLAGSAASSADSSAAVYVGTERLDPHRQMLGEPPLLDGAVVSLYGPALPATAPALAAYGSAKARLHVIAGPDAGGIHLLQGGKVHLGRSAEADVPLDDPDVSRLHCAVTVSDGGAVTVTDLDSTNGTSLDGAPVGRQPVLFRPGSTLRVGESALRVETSPTGSSDSDDDALSSLGGAAGSASDASRTGSRARVPSHAPGRQRAVASGAPAGRPLIGRTARRKAVRGVLPAPSLRQLARLCGRALPAGPGRRHPQCGRRPTRPLRRAVPVRTAQCPASGTASGAAGVRGRRDRRGPAHPGPGSPSARAPAVWAHGPAASPARAPARSARHSRRVRRAARPAAGKPVRTDGAASAAPIPPPSCSPLLGRVPGSGSVSPAIRTR